MYLSGLAQIRNITILRGVFMKRILTLSMVFCLLMALCLPCLASSVSAADIYVFERMPDVSFLNDSFVFLPEDVEGSLVLSYPGRVSIGSFMIRSSCLLFSMESCNPFSVSYDFSFSDDCFGPEPGSALFVISYPDSSFCSELSVYVLLQYFVEHDATLLFLLVEGSSGQITDLNFLDYVEFVPCDSVMLGPSLSADLLDGVLSQVVCLVPVVLGVVVSIYGIRKAIAFVGKILRNS